MRQDATPRIVDGNDCGGGGGGCSGGGDGDMVIVAIAMGSGDCNGVSADCVGCCGVCDVGSVD